MGILAQVDGNPPSMAALAPQTDQNIRDGLPGALGLLAQHQPDGIWATLAAAAPHVQPPAAQGSHRAGERDGAVEGWFGRGHDRRNKSSTSRESRVGVRACS